MTPAQKLISALFDPANVIDIRTIKDARNGARDSLHKASDVLLAESYPVEFPCIGINPRRTVRNLSAIKNLVIDIDNGPLPEWARDRADVICKRDAMHWHLFFCFSSDTDREQYKAAAHKLIELIPNADEHVSDPERVMRLPGFEHRKDGRVSPGYKVVFVRKKIDRLPIAEKFAWLNKEQGGEHANKKVNSEQAQPSAGSPAATAQQVSTVAAPNVAAYLKNLYLKKEKLNSGEGRSRRLWFVGIDCHAWGIPLDNALTLAAEINATFEPPEAAQVVAHQIKSAYKYAKQEFGALAQRAADATEAKQRAEKKAFERAQKVRDTFAGWVYVHAAARFCDSKTGYALTSKEQIEDYITSRIGEQVSLRDLFARDALNRCDRMEFDPVWPEKTFERDGLTFYNAYAAPRTSAPREKEFQKGAASAVKAFKEHIGLITTSEEEESQLIDYFAYCVQNKGRKVDWTPLLISDEGLGKSYFYKLFALIFGEHNCSSVAADNLLGGWTDFIAEKLFVVSHEVKMKETHGLEKLKSLISEDRVTINGKYARVYDTKNCANFLLLSNESDALRLTMKSRRFFVVFSRATPRDKAYYTNLFDSMHGGAGWIEDYLMSRDLKNFTPHGPAPKTEGLRILALASRGDGQAWLDERAAAGAGAFESPLTTAAQIAADAIGAPANVAKYITQRAASAWLANNGYRPVHFRVGAETRRAWFKGDEVAFQTELKKLKEKVEKVK